MLISQALRLGSRPVVAFVGAGGKTAALLRLADEIATLDFHRRVIITTTTHLFAAQVARAGALLRDDGSSNLPGRAQAELARHSPVVLVGQDEGERVAGLPPERIDALAALEDVDAILVEADGARMLALKAPAAHEPAVPTITTVLVPVVGAAGIGAPLDDAHVHRAEIFARLAGARLGEAITPEMVARVLAHPEGGLKGKPGDARVVVLVNQVENETQLGAARAIARLLLANSAVDAVALGAVQNTANPIRETHRRVAAIILAAGAGTRMGQRIKQLLPWRGSTLVENALALARAANVAEIVLVLGAHADEIRAAIEPTALAGPGAPRIVLNPDWQQGHSTSIRAGLQAIAPSVSAAIFVNADQPLLTQEIVNAVIQHYRETDAAIVAPRYAGKRGSPVLFDRLHFDALTHLTGEQGGREVLAQHPVAYVDFADARAGFDVDTPEEYADALRQAQN